MKTHNMRQQTPNDIPHPISRIHLLNVSPDGIYNITVRKSGKPINNIQYKNVFINGKLFVTNALDVKTVKLGSVVAVQCIDMANTKYWHLVNTKLQVIGQKFGPHIQFTKINDAGDALYLETTTHAIMRIDNIFHFMDINASKRFVINCR